MSAITDFLFNTNDHADAMAALGSMLAQPALPASVVPLRNGMR